MLFETPYSFRTRFEDEKRTNPEELIAAAYAFCLPWRRPWICRPPVSRRRSSRPRPQLRLIKTGRLHISRSALTLRAKVPNLVDAAFARIAGEVEKHCPVSKVLNATITLDAKLVP